jgi:hypothetical protein
MRGDARLKEVAYTFVTFVLFSQFCGMLVVIMVSKQKWSLEESNPTIYYL